MLYEVITLYWATNMVLSIAQQWKINKVVEQEQESEDEQFVEDSESQTPSYDFLDEQTDGLDNDTTSPTDDLDADTSAEDSDTSEDSSEVSDFVFEQDDGLEPEPDYFAAGTES